MLGLLSIWIYCGNVFVIVDNINIKLNASPSCLGMSKRYFQILPVIIHLSYDPMVSTTVAVTKITAWIWIWQLKRLLKLAELKTQPFLNR